MSEIRTCEDCKSFPGMGYHCPIIGRFCDPNNEKPCEFFEKPMGRIATNGDRIRQGRDFAEYFVYETGAVFASTLIVDKTFDTYEEAVKATEDYLNAPADCIAKNGESAKQADLCCKSAKESEVQ